ncbi:hypothetical protein HPB50_004862 [Hyalomma asiaticum]|uniref:Uncharacterized protein n=1 Tax=Hyalomma asiaticum TaxID=266040 RepID=A0ACB7SEK8_HYAAI|nr:hypothetical protein HPB50_004862 [Hyalomma asiaticum]
MTRVLQTTGDPRLERCLFLFFWSPAKGEDTASGTDLIHGSAEERSPPVAAETVDPPFPPDCPEARESTLNDMSLYWCCCRKPDDVGLR